MAVVAVIGIAMFVSVAVSQGPLPTTRVEGQIVGVGFADKWGRGSVREASVEVEGRTLRIESPTRLDCRVGDAVALNRLSARKGPLFMLAPVPTPCRRRA
ncbi:hypothetical protein GCM10009116_12290 [Brevundimonas basaltis]